MRATERGWDLPPTPPEATSTPNHPTRLPLGLATHFRFHAMPSGRAPQQMPRAELQLPLPKRGDSRRLGQPIKISICTLPLAQLYSDSRVWSQGYLRGRRGGKGNESITPQQKLPLTFQKSLHKLQGKILED